MLALTSSPLGFESLFSPEEYRLTLRESRTSRLALKRLLGSRQQLHPSLLQVQPLWR